VGWTVGAGDEDNEDEDNGDEDGQDNENDNDKDDNEDEDNNKDNKPLLRASARGVASPGMTMTTTTNEQGTTTMTNNE
jgi:hypothetical protein